MLAIISPFWRIFVFAALGLAIPFATNLGEPLPAEVSRLLPRDVCENDPNVVAGTYAEFSN